MQGHQDNAEAFSGPNSQKGYARQLVYLEGEEEDVPQTGGAKNSVRCSPLAEAEATTKIPGITNV